MSDHQRTESPRILAWFSAGAASAVATKLTISEHGHDRVTVAYCDTGSEHPDNKRFIADCEQWFEHEVTVLKSDQYSSVDDVIAKRKYITSPIGAPCTLFLKKRVRQRFERFDDIQVFGYTADKLDAARAVRFRETNAEVRLSTPLIDRGLTKSDTIAMIANAGVAVPAMYLLGYQNNNCIGCVKGGMGYWNKIRRDFPEVFELRAKQERSVGHAILSDRNGPVWLDELDPQRGNHKDEANFECSILCAAAEREWVQST